MPPGFCSLILRRSRLAQEPRRLGKPSRGLFVLNQAPPGEPPSRENEQGLWRALACAHPRESVRPPPQINALATGALAVREDFEVGAGS